MCLFSASAFNSVSFTQKTPAFLERCAQLCANYVLSASGGMKFIFGVGFVGMTKVTVTVLRVVDSQSEYRAETEAKMG